MSDAIEIKVEPKKERTLTVRLGDDEYEFRVPKLYGLLDAIQGIQTDGGIGDAQVFGRVEAWVFEALPDEDAQRIRARLHDDDDPLDVEHLVEVFQQLTKVAANRPSGSRRSA
jgi:hypothetical protein